MCDALFNRQIPQSTKTKIIIPPSSSTFVNGIAKQYDARYNAELRGKLSEVEFE